jgi:glycosyltransferase involved in cell wall biosynthesis
MHGGVMATHSSIQALASVASVSVVVLSQTHYSSETIRAGEKYYLKTCRSFVCHHFGKLFPSKSFMVKAWHYLSGYPRYGYWSEEAEEFLVEEMKKTGCTVLWCNSTFEAKYLPRAKRMNRQTVLMTHNVESDLWRQEMSAHNGTESMISWIRWWDLRRLEKMGAKWADIITGITDGDVEYYRRLKLPGRVFLLPFAYSALPDAIDCGEISEEPNTICFIGSMDWPPNIKAARYLVQEVLPLVWAAIPDAKCFLVGKNPPEKVRALSSDRVTVTGKVPSVREYYMRCALVVVPIQGVGGVKIKLIEAMGAGKAVVSTSAGAAGLKVEHNKHLVLADSTRDFASAIVTQLKSKTERERLGQSAQDFVAKHLSPKETEDQVEKILACLMGL